MVLLHRGGGSAKISYKIVIFLLPVFGVRVSVTCVHMILVRFRLLSGHLLGHSCSLG